MIRKRFDVISNPWQWDNWFRQNISTFSLVTNEEKEKKHRPGSLSEHANLSARLFALGWRETQRRREREVSGETMVPITYRPQSQIEYRYWRFVVGQWCCFRCSTCNYSIDSGLVVNINPFDWKEKMLLLRRWWCSWLVWEGRVSIRIRENLPLNLLLFWFGTIQ